MKTTKLAGLNSKNYSSGILQYLLCLLLVSTIVLPQWPIVSEISKRISMLSQERGVFSIKPDV